MPINREILYPFFLECIQYTTDSFWETIFEDLSYGQAPHGTYINKNYLCCNYRIEKKNPEILYNDIYNLFSKKLGLLSKNDKNKKKIDFQNIVEELKSNRKTWSKIRKKNIKDLIIENYVINMKKKYSLSIKTSRNLLSKIYIGLIFKIISVKDINYYDGKINDINGITFAENQIIFKRDIFDIDNIKNTCILLDKNLMSNNWNKYLNNLRKIANM
jgi:hypothetical protein